jgi:hypothetical protein
MLDDSGFKVGYWEHRGLSIVTTDLHDTMFEEERTDMLLPFTVIRVPIWRFSTARKGRHVMAPIYGPAFARKVEPSFCHIPVRYGFHSLQYQMENSPRDTKELVL